VIEILKQHQLWRRGLPPYEEPNSVTYTPRQLTKALDFAIACLSKSVESERQNSLTFKTEGQP